MKYIRKIRNNTCGTIKMRSISDNPSQDRSPVNQINVFIPYLTSASIVSKTI